jgi:predicted esterase
MRARHIFAAFITLSFSLAVLCQESPVPTRTVSTDPVQAILDTLSALGSRTDNPYFRMHFNSISEVIHAFPFMNARDTNYLAATLDAFNKTGDASCIRNFTPYLNRQRPLIISWRSPADGSISFSWLTLPKNWDPSKKYPLYVVLHGLWSVADDPLEYMTYPLRHDPSNSHSFEDGYELSPWGRGNYWYLGIAETDIWESIHALENRVQIEPSRRYLCGHSMGGYGAWNIAAKSADYWAALGIYAGALWYYPYLLTPEVADSLKDLPTYFVCGTQDNLRDYNITAYELLESAGNWHVQFVSFDGGHEYTETNVMNMYLWMRQYVNEDLLSGLLPRSGIPHDQPGIICVPNPVAGEGRIDIYGKDAFPATVMLFDLSGKKVRTLATGLNPADDKSLRFDTEGIPPGIYILKATFPNAACQVKIAVAGQ